MVNRLVQTTNHGTSLIASGNEMLAINVQGEFRIIKYALIVSQRHKTTNKVQFFVNIIGYEGW